MLAANPAIRRRSSAVPQSLVARSTLFGHVGEASLCTWGRPGGYVVWGLIYVRSDHSALCAGGKWLFVGIAPTSVWGQGVPGSGSRCCCWSSWPWTCCGVATWFPGNLQDCLFASVNCQLWQVDRLVHFPQGQHRQAPTGEPLLSELSVWLWVSWSGSAPTGEPR